MTDFKELFERLSAEGVEFIIVGGFAGAIHGSSRSTEDMDIVYRQLPENVQRILRALEPLYPYPRGAAQGLPFTIEVTVFGRKCRCLDLPKLISVKRAAGCPRDFEAIAELEALREEQDKLP